MKQMKVLFLASALLTLACNSSQSPPTTRDQPTTTPPVPEPPPIPFEIKGFSLGMKHESFRKIAKNPWLSPRSNKLTKIYVLHSTVAENSSDFVITFEDYGEGLILDHMGIVAKKSAFYDLKKVLITKFGEPTEFSEFRKSNAMGASFTGERLKWKNKIATMEFEEIGSKIDELSLELQYQDPQRRKSTIDIEKANKMKKDI